MSIVRYGGPDQVLPWTRQEILRLGDADAGPHAFVRVASPGTGADAYRRLYILDVGAMHVQVFDGSGEYLRTLGREGNGPGEMTTPSGVFVNEDEVRVVDFGRRMLIRYDTQGVALPEVGLPPEIAHGSRVVPLSDGGIMSHRDSADGPQEPGASLLRTLVVYMPEADGSWRPPEEVAQIEWKQPVFTPVGAADCPMKMQTPAVFSRVPVWSASGNRIFYNGWEEYRLDLRELDGRSISIRRDLPVRAATGEWAAREIGSSSFEVGGIDCTQTGEERAEQAGWADEVPWIVDVAQDALGRIWVQRRTPDEAVSTRIDLFGEDGEYIGTLPSGFPFPDSWRTEDEIVTIEQDELGVPYVVVHRVEENG